METIQQHRKLLQRPRPAARCSKSKRAATTLCTPATSADGFLNSSFLPKWTEAPEPLNIGRETERDFYASLSVMASKHGITPMDITGKPFPYNLLLSHWDGQRQLQRQSKDAELLLTKSGKGKVVLCNNEAYMTGSLLYYIPVEPLYRLLKDRTKKKSAELLLSVCSYLCRMAGVPYYTDNSYLAWHYEMIEDWVREGAMDFDNEQQYRQKLAEIGKAKHIGDVMGRRIYSSCQLEQLENRIAGFKPQNDFDKQCLMLADLVSSFIKEYPNNNIFSHLTAPENCEEVVMADQYISFVCQTEGDLFREIAQMVNEDFGNKGDMQNPVSYCYYDKNCNMDSVSYEQKLFPMMEELITLLNEI